METGELSVEDEVMIIGPTTGVIETKINEIRIDLKNAVKAKKGERFSIPVKALVRRSDKLYKIVEVKRDSLMD
jgi:putative protease